jgi:ankyrin repeat protein
MCFVEVRDEIWYRSLHCACNRENVDEVSDVVMNYTIENVNMTDQSGKTALHLACRHNTVEIVRVLLSVFASVNITL